MDRVYQLLNKPWVHGPRWWRARRVSKLASIRLNEEHVQWARKINRKDDLR